MMGGMTELEWVVAVTQIKALKAAPKPDDAK